MLDLILGLAWWQYLIPAAWVCLACLVLKLAKNLHEKRYIQGDIAAIPLIAFLLPSACFWILGSTVNAVTEGLTAEKIRGMLPLVGFYTAAGISIPWSIRRTISIGQWSGGQLRSAISHLKGWWKSWQAQKAQSDQAIIRRAQQFTRELFAALPGIGWDEEHRLIREVLNETLPHLLERRRQIKEHMVAVRRDLDRYAEIAALTLPQEMVELTRVNLVKLEELGRQTETDIGETLVFLDMVESNLRLAQVDTGERGVVRERFQELIGRVEQASAERRAAEREVEALRLPPKPSVTKI